MNWEENPLKTAVGGAILGATGGYAFCGIGLIMLKILYSRPKKCTYTTKRNGSYVAFRKDIGEKPSC